jgi:hypothetical protein
MQLRWEITADFSAGDYLEAGEHQGRLESVLASVRQQYPGANLAIRVRRERAPQPRADSPKVRHFPRLNTYVES